MKKFNLVKEIIVVDSNKLLQAVNSKKRFAITHKGDIKYAPFDSKDIFIFQSSDDTKPISSTSLGTIDYTALFGNTYQIVEDGERILIKAAGAWKNIIEINIENAEYDDTSSDGIAEFSDKKLEEIGWNATELQVGGINMSGVKRALESIFINCTFDSSTVINLIFGSECYVREVKRGL
jgi:hypothetical protein